MERKTISVKSNTDSFKKIKESKCNEMIANSILKPLLDIVYQFKESQHYNYIPGTTTDSNAGWEYYGEKFREIYKAINSNIFLSEYEYQIIYDTVQGIQSFTRQFSDADGLPDIFFKINPNLNYYTFALSEDGKCCRNCMQSNLENAPDDRDYFMSDAYHGKLAVKNQELNLRFDRDDFFIQELAYTIRKIFINTINRASKHNSKSTD